MQKNTIPQCKICNLLQPGVDHSGRVFNQAYLEILYIKEICHLQLKNVDLYVCPASFIKSRVSDQQIL